jgi:hypothetical protein
MKKEKSTKQTTTNWAKAKVDYLKSKELTVKEWGRQYFSSDAVVEGGNFAVKTKGWREEKESIWNEAQAEAIQAYREGTKTEAKIDVARAVAAKQKAWSILESILETAVAGRAINISMKDLDLALKIAKTELGEESAITKNLNVDLQEVKKKQTDFMNETFNGIQKLSNGVRPADDIPTGEDNEL